MEKERLKQLILDNQELILDKNYIPRDKKLPYGDLAHLEKIVAILGPRRAGKTYFIKQITVELQLKKNQIVFFDFSEISLSNFEPEDFEISLLAYYELFPDKKPYFFFDEIQEVSGFESGLKFLLNRGYKIYITGSSSKIIVEDLASSLRGKVLNFYLYPLSFSEYLRFKGVEEKHQNKITTKKKAFFVNLLMDFLKWGGFPEVVLSEKEETKTNLLSSYIDIMLFRDIIERHSVKNIHLIDKLFWKIVGSFTKEISVNKWYNDFKSQGLKISKDTLYLYLKYFEDSFFVRLINNSNKGPGGFKKVYLIDNGIYNHVKSFPSDKGKSFENLIFLDLLRQGDSPLSFFKSSRGETDFIYKNGAFQVCFSLSEENIRRELYGLDQVIPLYPGNNRKIIVLEESKISVSTNSAVYYLDWLNGEE
jgi:uncharacterized protein